MRFVYICVGIGKLHERITMSDGVTLCFVFLQIDYSSALSIFMSLLTKSDNIYFYF